VRDEAIHPTLLPLRKHQEKLTHSLLSKPREKQEKLAMKNTRQKRRLSLLQDHQELGVFPKEPFFCFSTLPNTYSFHFFQIRFQGFQFARHNKTRGTLKAIRHPPLFHLIHKAH